MSDSCKALIAFFKEGMEKVGSHTHRLSILQRITMFSNPDNNSILWAISDQLLVKSEPSSMTKHTIPLQLVLFLQSSFIQNLIKLQKVLTLWRFRPKALTKCHMWHHMQERDIKLNLSAQGTSGWQRKQVRESHLRSRKPSYITDIKDTWKHYLLVYFNDVSKCKFE